MIPTTLLAVALSYLLGSVPTGLWLGRALRGIDIREHGSKNIGATNAMRVLGKKLGAIALLADAAKGAIPVMLIAQISRWEYAPLACGIAAIAGHLASVFLRFRGGKGVATSAGVFLALCPVPLLAAVGAFALIVGATRMVSAGSIGAAIALAALVWALPYEWATAPWHLSPPSPILPVLVSVLALLVIVKHRANIQRILQGTENRI